MGLQQGDNGCLCTGSEQIGKQFLRPGGSSCIAGAQCRRGYPVQTGVHACPGPVRSLRPGAQAAIHQVFSAGNHRRGSSTTRSRGYGAGRGLAKGFYRLHSRSTATSGNRHQERRSGTRLTKKQGLHPSRRQALSAWRSVRSSHEVRHKGRWLRHTAGDPRRCLRQPCGFKNAGGESIQDRFLVAHRSDRRGGSRAQVPKLSILRQTDACSSPQPHHHTAILAFCLLES
jgi:hypothetical protein